MGIRYTVTEPMDRANVFRGIAKSSDGYKRDVAIMRVAPKLPRSSFSDLFLGELRSSMRLQHANIVELLDIAKTPEDAYYVVTEYVEGCDLKALVARRKHIAIPHVIHVIVECCKALTHAHSLDIIHRDLSPRAVVLSSKAGVKIGDFGLSKVNHQIESSDPGIVKGKFSYLSPETASGFEIDHRADIFATGILLWELLAGRRLFLGQSDYDTVALVRDARFVPIDGLDSALDAVVRKALARDPDARYQSASDLRDALTHYAISRGIKLSPSETARLVRDVGFEIVRERSVRAVDPIVQAEVHRMTSIIRDDGPN